MNKILLSFFLALSMAPSVSAAGHQLELAVPFTDNMILLSLFAVLGRGDAFGTRKDLVEVVGVAKAAFAGHRF